MYQNKQTKKYVEEQFSTMEQMIVKWSLHKNFDYIKYCVEIYNIFQQLGYEQDLTAYKLVIVPTPIVMEDRFKEN